MSVAGEGNAIDFNTTIIPEINVDKLSLGNKLLTSTAAELIDWTASNVGSISNTNLPGETFETSEKSKLATIESNANNYTLPQADASNLGGIKIGNGLEVDIIGNMQTNVKVGNGVAINNNVVQLENNLFVQPPALHQHVNLDWLSLQSNGGVSKTNNALHLTGESYTTAEQTKLAGIETGAQVNVGEEYTTAEQSKLAGIAANANNYSLPTASASVLGGIKIGSGLTIDAQGVVSGGGGGGAEYMHAELASLKYVGSETAQDPTGATLGGFSQNLFQSPNTQLTSNNNYGAWIVPSTGIWKCTFVCFADVYQDLANMVRVEAHITKSSNDIKSHILDLQPTGGGTSGENLRAVSLTVSSLLSLTQNDSISYRFACTAASGIATVKPTLTWIDAFKVA